MKSHRHGAAIVGIHLVCFAFCLASAGCGRRERIPYPPCDIIADEDSVSFGAVAVGARGAAAITLVRVGSVREGPMFLRWDPPVPEFALEAGMDTISLGEGSTRVNLTFSPERVGPKASKLRLIHGSKDCGAVMVTGVATPPAQCVATPSTLSFGDVDLHVAKDLSFTLRNDGTGLLAGEVAVSDCAGFSVVSGGGPYGLRAGEVRSVTIRFTPDVAGASACEVSLGRQDCGPVSCTGVGRETARCQVSPEQLTFGAVALGSRLDSSFSVKNVGIGLLGGEVGAGCSEFTVLSGNGPFELGAGESVAVVVRFEPTATHQSSCAISIGGTDCGPVNCTGEGRDAAICQITPQTLSFGAVALDDSTQRSFTIRNAGQGVLRGELSANCGEFRILSGAGQYALSAGEERRVDVRFKPVVLGSRQCDITTGRSDCGPAVCSGEGLGVPACELTPETWDYDDVEVGTRLDKVIELRNTGSAVLEGNISENCPEFSVASGGGTYSLSPGETRTIVARFAPLAAGSRTCEIDLGSPHCPRVTLVGNGTETPICELSTDSLSFGRIEIGTAVDRSLVVRNAGLGTLAGTVGEDCSEFTILSGGGPFALGPQESKTVVVRFEPTSTGDKSCSLDLGRSECAVSCSGTGRLDDVPPNRILDFRPGYQLCDEIELYWTEPGDDADVGAISSVEIRRSSSRIDASNWSEAEVLEAAIPASGPAGTRAYFRTQVGLSQGFFVAARARDERGNEAPVSESIEVQTLPDCPDIDREHWRMRRVVSLDWDPYQARYADKDRSIVVQKGQYNELMAIDSLGNEASLSTFRHYQMVPADVTTQVVMVDNNTANSVAAVYVLQPGQSTVPTLITNDIEPGSVNYLLNPAIVPESYGGEFAQPGDVLIQDQRHTGLWIGNIVTNTWTRSELNADDFEHCNGVSANRDRIILAGDNGLFEFEGGQVTAITFSGIAGAWVSAVVCDPHSSHAYVFEDLARDDGESAVLDLDLDLANQTPPRVMSHLHSRTGNSPGANCLDLNRAGTRLLVTPRVAPPQNARRLYELERVER